MIRLASPDIRNEDIERLLSVIRSGELVQGKAVEEFENALCDFSDIPHCAAVSSGTAALHLALLALGIGQGDRVLVPAFTFPATANAVEQVGASVILCDVDPGSYVVTPELVESALASSKDNPIKAVMLVHEFGFPADVAKIAEITKRYGAYLIEDAACALGTVAGGRHPGYYSDVACLSFHPRKAITTGEGGALLSRNPTLIDAIRTLRNHGIAVKNKQVDFIAAGLNYRLTNFQAALGVGQLARFNNELVMRKELANRYQSRLAEIEGIVLPTMDSGHSWQSFMVVLKGVSRDSVRMQLASQGVESNLGAQALNCLTYFRNKYQSDEQECPQATELFQRGLVLPLYGKLSLAEIDLACDKLMMVLR